MFGMKWEGYAIFVLPPGMYDFSTAIVCAFRWFSSALLYYLQLTSIHAEIIYQFGTETIVY